MMSALLLIAGCAAPPAYTVTLLQEWHETKAELGPTFAGSPSWIAHMDFVEQGLAEAGVTEVQKLPAPYTRWWSSDKPAPEERSLIIAGEDLQVASYWAYSGGTPADGVTAPLIVYKKQMDKAALRDRIVVFQVGRVPEQMSSMFVIGNEYATADFNVSADSIADDQYYQGNYVTRFGRFDDVLRDSGAAGAIVVFAMSAERLAGLYTFPLLNLGVVGVPGIYVDERVGSRVLAAAASGEQATLTLIANEELAKPYFYTAVLPGKNYGTTQDEQVLLVTHSDGPSLSQENGTLGILALIRNYARLPQRDRPRSLRVLFDPQHYSPGRHVLDWYAANPNIMSTIVGSLGVEQLGQREYGEGSTGYGLTGLPEPWQIFVRNDPHLIEVAVQAIESSNVPRTELRVPEIKAQGQWVGLGNVAIHHDLAGFATLSGMSGYWSTTAGIESFDASLAARQLGLLVALIDELMQMTVH